MLTVTNELMKEGMSRNGSWSDKQLRMLGIETTKNNPGWRRRLMGTIITEQQKKDFLALKDAHLCLKHPTLF